MMFYCCFLFLFFFYLFLISGSAGIVCTSVEGWLGQHHVHWFRCSRRRSTGQCNSVDLSNSNQPSSRMNTASQKNYSDLDMHINF